MSPEREYRLRLLVEAMVRDGHDEQSIAAAVEAADDRPRLVSLPQQNVPARARRSLLRGRRAAA